MIEFRKTVIRLLIRFLLAGMATWYGRYLIITAETEVMDISRLFAAMLCFVIAALVVAPQLLSFVVDVTGGVFGGGFGGKSRPFYRLAADKRARGRYQEALVELEKIVDEHPQEVEAYLEMLAITMSDLNDFEQARAICLRGKKALASRADRELVASAYRRGKAGV